MFFLKKRTKKPLLFGMCGPREADRMRAHLVSALPVKVVTRFRPMIEGSPYVWQQYNGGTERPQARPKGGAARLLS
jgi:hypothetical protein